MDNQIVRKFVNNWLLENEDRKTIFMPWKPEYIADVVSMICKFCEVCELVNSSMPVDKNYDAGNT